MSARVEANVGELSKATRTHRRQADLLCAGQAPPSRSATLLRFYGAESGLKAKYLRDQRLRTTRQIPEGTFGINGHDLVSGLRQLRIPSVVAGKLPTLHRQSNGDPIPVARSHEALRYGVDLRRADFDEFNRWLAQVLSWLDEEGGA